MRSLAAVCFASILAAGAAAPGLAADPPTSRPAAPTSRPAAKPRTPASATPGLLSGPKVDDIGDSSLVRRTFEGKLMPLDRPAPLAALALLDLDDAERAAVEATVASRASAIDRVLTENRTTFVTIIQAFMQRQGDRSDRSGMRQAMRDFQQLSAPIRERGTLRDEISRALPTDTKTQFDALLTEYEQALAASRPQRATDRPQRVTDRPEGEMDRPQGETERRRRAARRPAVANQRAGRELLEEFRAAYERTVQIPAADFNARLEKLDLDPATKEAFRIAVTEVFNAGDKTDDRTAFRRALEKLTPAQRASIRRAMQQARRDDAGG